MRILLRLTLALVIAVTALPALADGPVPDLRTRKSGVDWAAFLGPTADGKSPETGVLTEWPQTGPPVKWTLDMGEGYCAPATSMGRIFVFDRVRNLNRLRCLNAESGKPIWDHTYTTDYVDLLNYDGGPRCAPVIDGDRVYILGAEGLLQCLQVTDGKTLWKVNLAEKFNVVQNFFGFGACPVVEGDLLICQVGGSPATPGGPTNVYEARGDVKTNGTAIVALNKKTGEVVYKTGDELSSYAAPVIRTIGDRRWCFAFLRGGLLAFNPADGKVDFHYPWRSKTLESVNAANPVVHEDMVFISETYGPGSSLLKVKPDGGYDVVYRDEERGPKMMQNHWSTSIYHDGYLYGCSGRHSGGAVLRCVEFETGRVMWDQPKLFRSQQLYVDGHFVVLTEYGHLLLVKANPDKFDPVAFAIPSAGADDDGDGEPDRALKYPAWAAPVLSHGLLYVRGEGKLVCMELIPQKP